MAVYQGARLRTDALPAGGVAPRQARSAAPPSTTSSTRVRPMGLLMAVIVATTMLGLVYLTQTLGSSAANTEIWRLQQETDKVLTDTRNLQLQVLYAKDADEIIPKARDRKLKSLGKPSVLPAP